MLGMSQLYLSDLQFASFLNIGIRTICTCEQVGQRLEVHLDRWTEQEDYRASQCKREHVQLVLKMFRGYVQMGIRENRREV